MNSDKSTFHISAPRLTHQIIKINQFLLLMVRLLFSVANIQEFHMN